MKHFERDGLWFPADEPSNAVGGTLSLSRDGLQLKLIGRFREGWSPGRDRYPIIHGIVSQNSYGVLVSLYDCLTKSLALGSGGVASTILVVPKGMIGGNYTSIDYDQFESLDFTISYLSDWYGRTGLKAEWETQNDDLGLQLTYRRPPYERVALGDRTVILGYSISSSQQDHRATISEEAHVVVQPLLGMPSDQIIQKYVKPIQDLLTFATNTANEVEDIQFREAFSEVSNAPRRTYNWLQNQVFRLDSKQDLLSPSDMLFTYSDSVDAGINIFQSWLDFASKFDAFCAVYFASIYEEPRFLDEKFLRTVSSFGLLSSSLCGVSHRTSRFLSDVGRLLGDHFSPEDQRLASRTLADSGFEIELPFQLLGLLEENGPLVQDIIKMPYYEFVTILLDTLIYLRRRTQPSERRIFQGPDLFYAMQRIRVLIKILVVKELGFTPDRIANLLQRNPEYLLLKTL